MIKSPQNIPGLRTARALSKALSQMCCWPRHTTPLAPMAMSSSCWRREQHMAPSLRSVPGLSADSRWGGAGHVLAFGCCSVLWFSGLAGATPQASRNFRCFPGQLVGRSVHQYNVAHGDQAGLLL